MARVGAAGMAQNSHKTELIFMFKKERFAIIFGIKGKTIQFMLGFKPLTVDWLDFYKGSITNILWTEGLKLSRKK